MDTLSVTIVRDTGCIVTQPGSTQTLTQSSTCQLNVNELLKFGFLGIFFLNYES